MNWLLVPLYLASIVAANLITTHYGPTASVYTSFAFIGLVLTTRDRLHDLWRSRRTLKMAALIAAGGVLSYILNRSAVTIAEASCIAFAASETADYLLYSALHKWEWLHRSNISNFLSAAIDSLVFPTIAFGGVLWGITFGQFTAKVGGGLLFSLILAYRRREVATRMKVYLGGPINGCTDAEANDWREYVKPILKSHGHGWIDPMDRDYRGREMEPGIAAEIVDGDKADILAADVLLMNCPTPSVGTSMEILYGHTHGKRVIAVVPTDKDPSPWIVHHADVRYALTDALMSLIEQA